MALLVSLFLLAACGSDDDSAAGDAGTASASGTATEPAEGDSSASGSSPAEAEEGAAEEEPADADDTETDTAADDTAADETAEAPDLGRLVVLGQEAMLADVLSLGLKPVASGANVPEEGFLGMGDLDTDGIEVLDLLALSLEEVATYEADTIVTAALWADLAGGEDLVRALAERVVIVPDDVPQVEILTFLGEEFGVSGDADRLVEELAAAEAAAVAAVADFEEPCSVTIAAIYTGPSPAAFIEPVWDFPTVAVAMGCTLVPGPDAASTDRNGRAFLSLEQLDLLSGPTLVLLQSDLVEGERASLDELADNPIWQSLPAVADSRVVELDRLGYSGVAGRIRLYADMLAAITP
ncbi:MAG: hypothetical protein AAGA65_19310 [Actinomycetota bacterium]